MSQNVETAGITLQDILKGCVDGIFVIDRNRSFALFSDACERITGHDRASVVGTQCPCHDVTECRDRHDRSLAGALCPGSTGPEGGRSLRQATHEPSASRGSPRLDRDDIFADPWRDW